MLSTRVDSSFSVHKLETFLSNPGEAHLEGLVKFLRYIRENKTLGLKYYADTKYLPLSDFLRQANIKNYNQLTAFYDYSLQDCIDTVISTESYIIFYRIGPIDHVTHATGPVDQ